MRRWPSSWATTVLISAGQASSQQRVRDDHPSRPAEAGHVGVRLAGAAVKRPRRARVRRAMVGLMRVRWLLVPTICLSLVVIGAGSARSRTSLPLLIAVEGPQTGSQAPNGLDQLRGVRLAVRQLNAHGGLWNGRKVAILAANDKAEAARGKTVARQVIGKGIHFVIGPYNSSVGLANLSV